jgi:hypothetical protein
MSARELVPAMQTCSDKGFDGRVQAETTECGVEMQLANANNLVSYHHRVWAATDSRVSLSVTESRQSGHDEDVNKASRPD